MSGQEQPLAERSPMTGQASQPRLGPLLAVAGLCGGAGASTLTYLIARAATGSAERPVLAGDSGGPTAGLAACAGVETPRSLPEAAGRIAAGQGPPDGLFTELGEGLRLTAAGPRLQGEAPDPGGLARLLRDARAAHELTVLDCGLPAGPVARQVLELATHVAWVMPASAAGLLRGAPLLRRVPPEPGRRELLVARSEPQSRKPPLSELSALAAERNGPLVLLPDVPDPRTRGVAAAIEAARPALDAIESELRR